MNSSWRRLLIAIFLCCCGLWPTPAAGAKFSDGKYGVSIDYPDGYDVKAGELGEGDKGTGYLGPIPMGFVAPGGVRVITVRAPEGSYPRTDFVTAFFTVSVNQNLSNDQCARFPEGIPGEKRVTEKINGIEFDGVEQEDAAMNHQLTETYYHGFINGTCYEVGYGLATAGYGVTDGLKQVDRNKVLSKLRKILKKMKVRTANKHS